jgi:hypothetical protein
MGKELDAASEMAAKDVSGGFNNFKEAVYNFLENCFSWLSTHQGLALIIILGVLAIMTWLILRGRKYRKQLEEKVSSKSVEIGKKDALLEEQKNKLEGLQKKMSDQQGFISEALLRTIGTITGYDVDQLQIFFKFLTKISGNPLQIADTQMNSMPKDQLFEEESDNSVEENDAKEKIAPDTGPGEVVEANKSGEE